MARLTHEQALRRAYDRFEEAYGHLCDGAAQALADGVSADAVREAFIGSGARRACASIRAARRRVDQRSALVFHHASRLEVPKRDALREMIRLARVVKAAAESEWMMTIPTSDPNP